MQSSPEISRPRGVYWQGTRGRRRSSLLQALDNTANRRIGERTLCENFLIHLVNRKGANYLPDIVTDI